LIRPAGRTPLDCWQCYPAARKGLFHVAGIVLYLALGKCAFKKGGLQQCSERKNKEALAAPLRNSNVVF
jgi:hypothetical protein